MIHYHGGPITPIAAALAAWSARHAMISFANPDQTALAAEVCQSFTFDNGAYPIWKAGGGEIDIPAYIAWVEQWRRHPGFDWCLIPDVIDGKESDNDRLVSEWSLSPSISVPVWHMHERIERLVELCGCWPRVALGSSGDYAMVGTDRWWHRMGEAMEAICDEQGRPMAKLHGLRMLNPTVFSQLPLASADSTNVARNIGIDSAWTGQYMKGLTKDVRAMVLRERIEKHASASRWTSKVGTQFNLELVG